jgi:hypothetical protein
MKKSTTDPTAAGLRPIQKSLKNAMQKRLKAASKVAKLRVPTTPKGSKKPRVKHPRAKKSSAQKTSTPSGIKGDTNDHPGDGVTPDMAAAVTDGAAPDTAAAGTDGAAPDTAAAGTDGAAPDTAAADLAGASITLCDELQGPLRIGYVWERNSCWADTILHVFAIVVSLEPATYVPLFSDPRSSDVFKALGNAVLYHVLGTESTRQAKQVKMNELKQKFREAVAAQSNEESRKNDILRGYFGTIVSIYLSH